MTIRSIIFSAPMVRALLEGRKTQTRRIVDGVPPQPGDHEHVCKPGENPRHAHAYLDAYCGGDRTSANPRGMTENWCWWTRDDRCGLPQFKVNYVPGDLLYVREAWGHDAPDLDTCRRGVESDGLSYGPYFMADGKWADNHTIKRNPSIHMPRWASRLTLAVTEVRVQRLQEISEGDAFAEGIYSMPNGSLTHDGVIGLDTAALAFARLWRMIHGAGAWDENPWVVAVTFDVHKINVDKLVDKGGMGVAA